MNVEFTPFNVIFLWCVPKRGATLRNIVQSYCFINRDAAPNYEVLNQCISKAIKAGILKALPDHTYRLDDDWYARLHRFDQSASNEFDSMSQFEETFLGRGWPCVSDLEYTLDAKEYHRAIQ
jgi:hypothetical protein